VTMTWKLYAAYGSSRMTGGIAVPLSLGEQGLPRLLVDTEDHELGREHGRHPDDADQPAVLQVLLGHRGAVAGHEERLVRRRSGQRARAPDRAEEVRHRLAYQRPQRFAVRLEDDPLGPLVDGLFEEEEQPPHVDVLPRRVGR